MNLLLFLFGTAFFFQTLTASAQSEAAVPAPAAVSLFSEAEEYTEKPQSGEALLAACAARMPRGEMVLSGALNMRRRYGVSLKEFSFSVISEWKKDAARFQYRFAGPDGAAISSWIAERNIGSGLSVHRIAPTGERLKDPVNPAARIEETDITWLDATLDFIWWREPRIVGEESVKGRLCDILEVVPPAPIPGCRKARIWIDRAQCVVLQALQYDEQEKPVRKLWVRAVQKIDDLWMLKDLEVETIRSGHRTRLHFESVTH